MCLTLSDFSAFITPVNFYVVSSLNLQERNILDFLVESVSAARASEIPPSLQP